MRRCIRFANAFSDMSSGQRLAARPLSLWLIQLTEGVRYQQKTPAVCDVIISWVIDIIQPNISKIIFVFETVKATHKTFSGLISRMVLPNGG